MGIDASAARVVNTIFRRLRAQDAQAQLIFCPTYYWGDGTGKITTVLKERPANWTRCLSLLDGRCRRRPGSPQAAETSGASAGIAFSCGTITGLRRPATLHLGHVVDRDPTWAR